MSQSTPTPWPWSRREVLLAVVLLAGSILAMWDCWVDWLDLAWKLDPAKGTRTMVEENSHVLLVVPFIAMTLWLNRPLLAKVRGGPSWVGPLIVLAGWGMSAYGFTGNHQWWWHMGAAILSLGAIVTALGHGVLVRFWPVLLLLAFIVPMPNAIRLNVAQPLQTTMAATAAKILGWLGQDVGRQGNSLIVNGKQVLVVEACNGLRLVFTLIMVSWLFAFITPLKGWVRALIIVLSPVTALVCNVIRLVPTLYLFGHASKSTAEQFHDYAGWAMLIVAFFLLMGVIRLVEALGFDVREPSETGAKPKDEESTPAPVLQTVGGER